MEKREIDEHLETLWHLWENDESNVDQFRNHTSEGSADDILQILQSEDYIAIDGKKVQLTSKGAAAAEQIIRRHRLAERLLTDVLGMESGDIETGDCEFEHILAPEIVDSICTLLGHPRECPHGGRIPEGECCRQTRKTIFSAVVPLPDVEIGEEVKVAYVKTASNSRMHKLSHFGVVPGTKIALHQRYPSFVIKLENTQVALEQNIAEEIYVWRPEGAPPTPSSPLPPRKRWRFRRGW